MNLSFTALPWESKVFKTFKEYGVDPYIFSESPLAWNYHDLGVRPSTFEEDAGLRDFWNVTTISYINATTPFVATIEAKDFPFFASQFHPEMVSQNYKDNYGVNHSWKSLQANRQFGRLFIEYARENTHSFGSFEDVQKNEISNFHHFLTSTSWGDVYVFE